MARRKQISGQQSLFGDAPKSRSRSPRYGSTARSSDMGTGPDLDTTSTRRRIHEAVVTFPEDVDDWEDDYFSSSRVASGRYSPARRQLILEWTNGRQSYIYDAVPPAVWTGLRSAGSAGQYVNHTLNTFPYRPYDGGY